MNTLCAVFIDFEKLSVNSFRIFDKSRRLIFCQIINTIIVMIAKTSNIILIVIIFSDGDRPSLM